MIEQILAKLTDEDVLHLWEEGLPAAFGPDPMVYRSKLNPTERAYLDRVNDGEFPLAEEFQAAIEKRLGVKFDEDGYVIAKD